MKKPLFILLILNIFFSNPTLEAQELKAYQLYNKKGTPVSFSTFIEDLSANYDIVLFGEYHDNALNHWLELKTTQALYQKRGEDLILGAEMFERDNAQEVKAYVTDHITGESFAEEARLWPNYKTDYKPLLDFAKTHQLPFIATNVPRHYAQLVAQHNMDTLLSLTRKEQSYIAKLPLKVSMRTPGYNQMKDMMMEHAGSRVQNYINAQALKDATMAESIQQNWEKGKLFLHFNGNFHSKAYGGIYWYLKRHKKFLQRLRVAVITVVQTEDEELSLPENIEKTEAILVLPQDMTRTF